MSEWLKKDGYTRSEPLIFRISAHILLGDTQSQYHGLPGSNLADR